MNLKEVHQNHQHDDSIESEVGHKTINLVDNFRLLHRLDLNSFCGMRFAVVLGQLLLGVNSVLPVHDPIETKQPESKKCRRADHNHF